MPKAVVDAQLRRQSPIVLAKKCELMDRHARFKISNLFEEAGVGAVEPPEDGLRGASLRRNRIRQPKQSIRYLRGRTAQTQVVLTKLVEAESLRGKKTAVFAAEFNIVIAVSNVNESAT